MAIWFEPNSYTQILIMPAQYRIVPSQYHNDAGYLVVQIAGHEGHIKAGERFATKTTSFDNLYMAFDFLNPVLPSLSRGAEMFSQCWVRRDSWRSVVLIFGAPLSDITFSARAPESVITWLKQERDAAWAVKQKEEGTQNG
jgi:hypothetical protein